MIQLCGQASFDDLVDVFERLNRTNLRRPNRRLD